MRKMRLFLAAATFCSAIAVGYSAYTNATMTEQERLILANVEALTGDEDDEVTCVKDKGDTCMVGNTPVSDYDEKSSWF